jgi:hypothetical protein
VALGGCGAHPCVASTRKCYASGAAARVGRVRKALVHAPHVRDICVRFPRRTGTRGSGRPSRCIFEPVPLPVHKYPQRAALQPWLTPHPYLVRIVGTVNFQLQKAGLLRTGGGGGGGGDALLVTYYYRSSKPKIGVVGREVCHVKGNSTAGLACAGPPRGRRRRPRARPPRARARRRRRRRRRRAGAALVQHTSAYYNQERG